MSVKILLVLLIVVLFEVALVGLRRYQSQIQVLGLTTQSQLRTQQLDQDIKYWEQVASASPTYREAYIQLVALNYQLNQPEVAREWLEKVLQLDPNWIIPTPLSSLRP